MHMLRAESQTSDWVRAARVTPTEQGVMDLDAIRTLEMDPKQSVVAQGMDLRWSVVAAQMAMFDNEAWERRDRASKRLCPCKEL